MELVKYEEWKASSGKYYVCAKTHIGQIANQWWFPARIFNLTPADFITLLHDKYKAQIEMLNDKQVLYYWNSKDGAKAHQYVLDVNRNIRKLNLKM